MATIRRTSQPYQYMLAINRVFEEGEGDLQDESGEECKVALPLLCCGGCMSYGSIFFFADSALSRYVSLVDDEKNFLIDGAMQFRKVVATAGTSFTWQGLASVLIFDGI